MEDVNPADQPNRSIAKRQIARLLSGSSYPMYVLSEDDTLVFANDAMGAFAGRSPESLLGLACSSPIPKDDASDSRLKAFLSLPIAWSRRQMKIVPFVHPFQNASTATPFEATLQNNTHESVRCLIPLENTGAGCTLCILCDMDRADSLRRSDEHAAIVQQMLMESRARYAHLNELWFLQGKSALTRRALEQTQLAIANSCPITILGAKGSGKTWLAQAIHAHRCNPFNAAQFDGNSALIRIECGLMDAELLQSMFELIDESIKDESKHPAILLDGLELLPDGCLNMLSSYLTKNSRIHCITTCVPEEISAQRAQDAAWKEIVLRSSTIRIELPRLTERIEDFRTLINAWFEAQPRNGRSGREFTTEFVDALIAYPWPEDVEEFANVLAIAISNASDGESLAPRHLPVNVRTCASYFENNSIDDSVDLDAILEDVERTMILRAIERFPQNKTSAAKLLNISRARLIRRLQQWRIQADGESNSGDIGGDIDGNNDGNNDGDNDGDNDGNNDGDIDGDIDRETGGDNDGDNDRPVFNEVT